MNVQHTTRGERPGCLPQASYKHWCWTYAADLLPTAHEVRTAVREYALPFMVKTAELGDLCTLLEQKSMGGGR
jgi:hypothetical protein